MAYYSIEPFGERAAYWRMGVLAATMANVHRGKRSRAFRPDDFMPPEPKPPREPQSAEQMAVVLRQAFEYAQRKGLTKKEN